MTSAAIVPEIVADAYTYVVGVDTHATTHHYAVIETRTGGVIDDAEFPPTPRACFGQRTGSRVAQGKTPTATWTRF